jgi:hypothetical protein
MESGSRDTATLPKAFARLLQRLYVQRIIEIFMGSFLAVFINRSNQAPRQALAAIASAKSS